MKRILYLLTAILLTASVANAQIQKGSIWYEDYYKLNCLSVSGNTIRMHIDVWEDVDENFTLTKTANNTFSLKNDEQYPVFDRIKTVEYRAIGELKLLLFKDAKGNILNTFEQTNDEMWEAEILKGVHRVLDGTYVDEKGTKYVINGDEFTMGGKKLNFSVDMMGDHILEMSDDRHLWWAMSTTGINIYECKFDPDNGYVQGALWHKLKEVSPNGRWEFLSNEIVPSGFMWRYPSGMVRIIRNEIYARHGYVFNSADLKEYFSKQPWYKPLNNNNAVKLNAIETLNVEILKFNETTAREGTDDEEIEEGLQ